MAGIGFSLRSLGDADNLLAPMASIGHAAVIAAGPWLFTVAALALIGMLTAGHLPSSVLDGFRLAVVYAFAISLIASAPFVLVAARLVGDALYARDVCQVRPLFLAASVLSAATAFAVALLCYLVVYGVPAAVAIPATSCSAIGALIWVALAMCGAVRDYNHITRGFLCGLGAAVAATVLAARWSGGWTAMIWAFNAGLIIVLAALAGRVLVTFPHPVATLSAAFSAFGAGLARHLPLALAGLLGAIALWIDKWVMWRGAAGVDHELGLVHAPFYDSAIFTAHLTIIPALALFVVYFETTFYAHYRSYYAAIREHATLGQIEDQAERLRRTTLASLGRITFVQTALCLVVALGAGAFKPAGPMIVLQAVALAGGISLGAGNTAELIEGAREQERAGKLTHQLMRLLVRRARLEAERGGGTAIQTPAELVARVGTDAAAAMLSAEQGLLRLDQSRREAQRAEAAAAVVAARKEIEAVGAKLLRLDALSRVHGEHLNDLRKLEGLTTRTSVIRIRSDLAEAEARREDTHAARAAAEARLVQAEGALARLSSDHDAELARAIVATEAEIADVRLSLQSASMLTAALGQRTSRNERTAQPVYEIVRNGRGGPTVLAAQESMPLLPDDVLNVRLDVPPQAAGALLASQRYLDAIDAVSKESLLTGLKGHQVPNTAEDIAWSLSYLRRAQKAGLTMLAIEYLDDPSLVAAAAARHAGLGFVPFFGDRLLDRLPVTSRNVEMRVE